MASEVYEETLELNIGLVEASVPQLPQDSASYPMLRLRPTGETERRTFRAVVLENSYLRATILPDLGGRIYRLLDKRTDTETLPPPDVVRPEKWGRRGSALKLGIELVLTEDERLNSMGSVAYQFAESDGSEAGVWLGELEPGSGLSFNAMVSLPADRAHLVVEVRVFNRTLQPSSYNGGVVAWLPGATRGYDPARQAGLGLVALESPMDGKNSTVGRQALHRFAANRLLSARQLDTFRFAVLPISGLASVTAFSQVAALCVGESEVTIQAAAVYSGAKLVLLTEGGQTLEALLDLYPERVSSLSLADLPARPTGFVILDSNRQEILRHDGGSEPATPILYPVRAAASLDPMAPEDDLMRATFDPEVRSAAWVLLANRSIQAGEYQVAADRFESALLFNAEDHLAWLGKAMAHRLAGEHEKERTELLNAHFLAPLEPALRAESFLSLGQELGKEPNALVRVLEESPESFIEIAAWLLEAGAYDQVTRWIDESLRHIDLPMLRYFQAYSYLKGSRMKAEAAELVAAAGRKALAPPLPWRPIERIVLQSLNAVFPADQRVREYLQLQQEWVP